MNQATQPGLPLPPSTLLPALRWAEDVLRRGRIDEARLTSELILLFLYIGYMSLAASIDDPRKADKASAVLALVGVINVPIIYFSVQWWNTLHQGASVSITRSPSMAAIMLWGMLVMVFAFWAYCIGAVLLRVRHIIRERERHAAWTGAGA